MPVDFSTMNQDTKTGTVKKKQLPYLNDGQQQNVLPVVQPDNTAQGNTSVMQAAQNAALNQPAATPTMEKASQMTQKMMTNPNFGYDPQKYKTTQLSIFDADRAATNQAMRQKYADIAGSGELQENLMKTLLAQNTDRAKLANDLDMQAYNTQKQNWIDAINQGLLQSQDESAMKTQAINNLLNVRGAYEPERYQTQAQGFSAGMSELDQQHALEQMAASQGYNLETMNEAQKNNLATMAAAAGYDIEKINTAQQNAIELANLGHKNALEELETRYGYDEAARYSEQQFEKAMATQNFTQARTIQQDRMNFEADQAIADRALTQSRIDIDELANNYSMLKDAVSSGQASPSDLVSFLNEAGIDVTAANTAKATKEAIDAEYAAQEYQFAKTHPDMVDPINQELTDEGKQQFLDFFNKAVFGDTGINDYINNIVDAKQLINDPEAYAQIYETAPEWTPDVSRDGRGFWNPDVRTINNAPAEGTYFVNNGNLYYTTSGIAEETKGQNYQYFTALDVKNGTSVKIRANENANGIEGI